MSLFEGPFDFQYRCLKCKTGFRTTLKTLDAPPTRCKTCGRLMLSTRVLHTGLSTDTTFMSGSHVDDGFGNCEWMRTMARQKAAAAGVDVNGARYCPELCPPGEQFSPKAWVRDKADVAKKAAALGYGVEGMVNAPPPDVAPEPEKPYRASDAVVKQRVDRKIKESGEKLSPTEYKSLWHKEADLASGVA